MSFCHCAFPPREVSRKNNIYIQLMRYAVRGNTVGYGQLILIPAHIFVFMQFNTGNFTSY